METDINQNTTNKTVSNQKPGFRVVNEICEQEAVVHAKHYHNLVKEHHPSVNWQLERFGIAKKY